MNFAAKQAAGKVAKNYASNVSNSMKAQGADVM